MQKPEAPLRRCIGCRKTLPRNSLLRLAVDGGQVVPDPGRRLAGRGCSICRDPGCVRAAIKSRAIGRALRSKAPDPAIDRVLEWLSGPRFA